MKHSVIAIGLDSVDPLFLEDWMSKGYLKTLATLKEQGAYGRLINNEYYKGESAWTSFLTGCLSSKTGYWSKTKFDPINYQANKIGDHGAYDYREYSPFYALGDDYRVAMFDMPQTTIAENVNGIQAVAWGAHAPMISRQSQPPELISELVAQYGDHPADCLHHRDRSDWYNLASVDKLKKELEIGLERRTAMTKDLLARERWDLFLTNISETHTFMHYFWHLSQKEHPLYQPSSVDPMLEYFKAVDHSIATILTEAPEDANIIIFSAHGMGENASDVLSSVVLPEFLYRFSFPGKSLVKSQNLGVKLPKPLTPKNRNLSWFLALYDLKNEPDPLAGVLRSIAKIIPGRFHRNLAQFYKNLSKITGSIHTELFQWHPGDWYKPFWPKMKAFYLPGFSDGYIRINLQGRESKGIVPVADYDAVCNELIKELHLLKDARTGKAIVKKVVRTRSSATDNDPKLPDADLVVLWEDWAVDVVDSPTYGRIGPVYFNRSSAHRDRGFVIAKGPNIHPGSKLAQGHAVDLSATILELMGAPVAKHLDGQCLTYADGSSLVPKEQQEKVFVSVS
ncbi:conserved hypothetical protein [Gloeothece citriformis PCC 7424]|uniref:Type I phosphodiesterase/nucleotide pyrophosphatase n=1 Tax=Gloeothece citriformis (strain PCC 7424) TaxID=65393 RepID=B7KAH9_GLOC7|nr:alkaline phosphatase family protein [Gloeothece citriformis]ACK72953.1 conserved hypothetical protein [Gloeothece citriformis PCC 7424]